MRIEVTEETGIRHQPINPNTPPYGHLKCGEVREVDDADGRFFVANGWARDVEGNQPTGERGKLDRTDPAKFPHAEPSPRIDPQDSVHE
jgi:8-oxo-dGTP pyrophosphatase MutT (NUDIX family)